MQNILLTFIKKTQAEIIKDTRVEKAKENDNKMFNNLALGGLIGIDIVITQAFISLGSPDFWALISLSAFAISIPLLSAFLLIEKVLNDKEHTLVILTKGYASKLLALSIFTSFLGICFSFAHISFIIGLLFILSSFLGFIIARSLLSHSKKIEQKYRTDKNKSSKDEKDKDSLSTNPEVK